VSGGVLHHGTHEEDGPVTREVLASPRTTRSYGEPVTRLRRAACWQEHARPVQNKLLHRGRPLTRGTEVAAEGGEEVGGLRTSFDVGELAGNSDPAEQRRPV
jgi:hypothetical protein